MSSKQLQPLDFFFFYSYRYRLPIIPFSPTYLSRSQVIINSSKQSCSFWAFSFLIRGISGYCYRNGNTGIEIHQIKLINFESLRNNCSLFFFFFIRGYRYRNVWNGPKQFFETIVVLFFLFLVISRVIAIENGNPSNLLISNAFEIKANSKAFFLFVFLHIEIFTDLFSFYIYSDHKFFFLFVEHRNERIKIHC